MQKIEKPTWWPDNPYPETIFPMKRERYPEIVPDPELRTALSGCLGHLFWDIASESIWHRLKDAVENGDVVFKPFIDTGLEKAADAIAEKNDFK